MDEDLDEQVDPDEIKGTMEGMTVQNYHIDYLETGKFFGEIGLITKSKRTATIKSHDYCTFAQMKRTCIK